MQRLRLRLTLDPKTHRARDCVVEGEDGNVVGRLPISRIGFEADVNAVTMWTIGVLGLLVELDQEPSVPLTREDYVGPDAVEDRCF